MPFISAIEPQKNNKHRSSLFIDGRFVLGVHNTIVQKQKLSCGKEVDEQALITIAAAEERHQALLYCYRLLSRGSYTEMKIKQKLQNRGYEAVCISEVIEQLKQDRYIDDVRYAHALCLRYKNKGAGRYKIKAALMRHGISDTIVHDSIAATLSEADEYAAARKQAARITEGVKLQFSDPARIRRIEMSLKSKGFSSSIRAQVIRELLNTQSNTGAVS